jgi:predicted PurR-regulated permease PerM
MIVIFGVLFGVLGVLLAVPLTVTIFVAVKKLYVRETLGVRTEVPGETEGSSS